MVGERRLFDLLRTFLSLSPAQNTELTILLTHKIGFQAVGKLTKAYTETASLWQIHHFDDNYLPSVCMSVATELITSSSRTFSQGPNHGWSTQRRGKFSRSPNGTGGVGERGRPLDVPCEQPSSSPAHVSASLTGSARDRLCHSHHP